MVETQVILCLEYGARHLYPYTHLDLTICSTY